MAGAALLLLLIPPGVFLASGLGAGMGMHGVFDALVDQYAAERTNLAVISVLGAAPLLLLLLALGIRRLVRKSWDDTAIYAVGGALPVLAVSLIVNLQYWPKYLPERTFLGFPHGLEFIIGPGVFAPIGMVIGVAVVWIARR